MKLPKASASKEPTAAKPKPKPKAAAGAKGGKKTIDSFFQKK